MTGKELDAKVQSLRSVGGLYEFVAWWVEHDNRPYVTEDEP